MGAIGPKQPKKSMAEIYELVYMGLTREPDFNYGVFQIPDGPRLPVRIQDGVVNFCIEENLAAYIIRYVQTVGLNFTARNAVEAVNYWKLKKDPIADPAIFSMFGSVELCYHKIPFELKSEGQTPLFDEILSRASDPKALQLFIGSLFDPFSDRQQYLWLYGEGNNGKGCLLRLLQKTFGSVYFATETPHRDDKFWTFDLYKKRVITFPDCDDYSFPASQKFKMLSGDDPIKMQAKGKMPFNSNLQCKFIFASNEKPNITRQSSDLRRAIYCSFEKRPDREDYKYEEKLFMEAPIIFGNCLRQYQENCKQHGRIYFDHDELLSVIDEYSSDFDSIFEDNFALEADVKKYENKRWRFSRKQLSKVLKQEGIDKKYQQTEFRTYLSSKHGIKYKTVKLDSGRTVKSYVGAYVLDVFLHEPGNQEINRPEIPNYEELIKEEKKKVRDIRNYYK